MPSTEIRKRSCSRVKRYRDRPACWRVTLLHRHGLSSGRHVPGYASCSCTRCAFSCGRGLEALCLRYSRMVTRCSFPVAGQMTSSCSTIPVDRAGLRYGTRIGRRIQVGTAFGARLPVATISPSSLTNITSVIRFFASLRLCVACSSLRLLPASIFSTRAIPAFSNSFLDLFNRYMASLFSDGVPFLLH